MMSSSPETTTRTTGAHRTHHAARETREAREEREGRDRAAARTLAHRMPTRYEPYLDGLFTYCLSVLCDHDAATAALRDVLALAERRAHRVPEAAADRRAWLYALARWACLRGLTEAKQKRQATHAAGRPAPAGAGGAAAGEAGRTAGKGAAGKGAAGPAAGQGSDPALAPEPQEQRRRELALLAWPEAAGTTPEQREALELAVRHHLGAHEVAAVLGMAVAAARELLASAACEVERTRAALAVVEAGGCPGVAHLTGDSRLVLSTALRRELVRHVDDCPRCRRTAERAAAPGRWPGTTVTPAELPVLEAPRADLHRAFAHHARARGADVPRFDRRGFPMDPKDRAARRDRLRARAVTTTVVATVVAAPVLALWAAYRGAPTAEGEGRSPSTSEAQGPDALADDAGGGYENAGNASVRPGAHGGRNGKADVSVEVVSVTGAGRQGAGRLDVTAANDGDTTLITLAASGTAPVRWSASTAVGWLYLSRSSGTLAPGGTSTIKVYVDHLREPSGHWHAQVAVAPAGTVVTIDGYGTAPTRPTPPAPPPSSAQPTPPTAPPTTPPSTPPATPPSTPPTAPSPTPTPPASPSPPPTASGSDTPSPSGS
ncbi:hypothetical protein [Streptomyces sp. NPDC048665]|uniref:BACON domain-containing protein n=1 Tax=Streptomyces sp. NPDC048665 TaxID=3155490 RepID=UPI0034372C19